MKLVKSLLLGSAAALAATAGASAADLPVRKAAPVDYVRVCSAAGTGFFFIPGTETCLRISGRVRAEYRVQETYNRFTDATGFRARAQLNLDARTQTAYGQLRTFFRFEHTRNTGPYAGLAATSGVNTIDINKAFIQFAGITAGRTTSFFDFYANSLNWAGGMGSDTYGADPVVLAYTASFGSGFTATISLEDVTARRVQNALLVGGGVQPFAYAGQRMPDIVANLRVDQAWGSAQLSGIFHQLNSGNTIAFVPPVGPALGVIPDSEWGWAVQAGVKLNMPYLAPGDQLWLQAAYADGVVNALGSFNPSGNLGRLTVALPADAIINGNLDIEKTSGFNLTAAFLHYWTPQIRQAIFGSWTSIDYSNTVRSPLIGGGFFAAGAATDANILQVGTNLIWSPVAGLDLGLEVFYAKYDPSGRIVTDTIVGPGGPVFLTTGSEDNWQARLRIQRDF